MYAKIAYTTIDPRTNHSTLTVAEVCDAVAVNDARQAYVKPGILNVFAQPATAQEYIDWSWGKEVRWAE